MQLRRRQAGQSTWLKCNAWPQCGKIWMRNQRRCSKPRAKNILNYRHKPCWKSSIILRTTGQPLPQRWRSLATFQCCSTMMAAPPWQVKVPMGKSFWHGAKNAGCAQSRFSRPRIETWSLDVFQIESNLLLTVFPFFLSFLQSRKRRDHFHIWLLHIAAWAWDKCFQAGSHCRMLWQPLRSCARPCNFFTQCGHCSPWCEACELLWSAELKQLKLGDFGMAISRESELSKAEQIARLRHPTYVTSWHRPPELWNADIKDLPHLLDWPVDAWSYSCVVHEMLTGKALFRPAQKFRVEELVAAWASSFNMLRTGVAGPSQRNGTPASRLYVRLAEKGDVERIRPAWSQEMACVSQCCKGLLILILYHRLHGHLAKWTWRLFEVKVQGNMNLRASSG